MHAHRVSDEGMGRAVKNSLEIIIKQVCLEGGFERGGRIRVAECLRQIVPDRCASIRKRSFTKCFCVYMGGDKGSCVRYINSLSPPPPQKYAYTLTDLPKLLHKSGLHIHQYHWGRNHSPLCAKLGRVENASCDASTVDWRVGVHGADENLDLGHHPTGFLRRVAN